MDIDLLTEPLGQDLEGRDVFLKDIWPAREEIRSLVRKSMSTEMFSQEYSEVFTGDDRWLALDTPLGENYAWDPASSYVKAPPFFEGMLLNPPPLKDISQARVLVKVGDTLTTDHISPAGAIPDDSPAGKYLIERGIEPEEFNSFGSRRGNHEVMMRGTFGNIRLHNLLTPGREGNWTLHFPDGRRTSIYEAAMEYREEGVPLIVLAGKEYGTGSSRDWAAKGTKLLGVEAVIAESFERIHRSNLIGMGVLPLQFLPGQSYETLELTGSETFDIGSIAQDLESGSELHVKATDNQGATKSFSVLCRVDTPEELKYYQHGGILHYVIRQLLSFRDGP
jgi:aconitate hydratase